MENIESDKLWLLESAQNTDRGKKRSNNEDWVTGFEPSDSDEIRNSGSLYIVADGVGGASKGERASQFAADKVLFDFFQEPNLDPTVRLQKAMRKVCNEIYEYTMDNNLSRMATTMVAANIRGDILTVANVGDSRCYLIRSGKVVQITQDHNVASELVRNGSLSPDAAKHAKGSNTLLRSLGGEPDVDVDIFGEIDLYPGDIVLLCSDGLTRYVGNDDLLRFCSAGTAEQMSQRLIDFANESGGADNVSVYVIKVGSEYVHSEIDEAKTLPVPISLDSYKPKKKTNRMLPLLSGFRPLNRGKIVNIGLFTTLIVLVTFGAVYLSKGDADPPATPVGISSVTPSSSLPGLLPIESTNSTLVISPTDSLGEFPLSHTETALPLDFTPSSFPTETATITATQAPTAVSSDKACVHIINLGEWISTIFPEFGLNYANYYDYYRYEECKLEERMCSGRRDIENPGEVDPGWYLFIPEVNEKEKCEAVPNSYWMSVNP